jgi:hypothetical protein
MANTILNQTVFIEVTCAVFNADDNIIGEATNLIQLPEIRRVVFNRGMKYAEIYLKGEQFPLLVLHEELKAILEDTCKSAYFNILKR